MLFLVKLVTLHVQPVLLLPHVKHVNLLVQLILLDITLLVNVVIVEMSKLQDVLKPLLVDAYQDIILIVQPQPNVFHVLAAVLLVLDQVLELLLMFINVNLVILLTS